MNISFYNSNKDIKEVKLAERIANTNYIDSLDGSPTELKEFEGKDLNFSYEKDNLFQASNNILTNLTSGTKYTYQIKWSSSESEGSSLNFVQNTISGPTNLIAENIKWSEVKNLNGVATGEFTALQNGNIYVKFEESGYLDWEKIQLDNSGFYIKNALSGFNYKVKAFSHVGGVFEEYQTTPNKNGKFYLDFIPQPITITGSDVFSVDLTIEDSYQSVKSEVIPLPTIKAGIGINIAGGGFYIPNAIDRKRYDIFGTNDLVGGTWSYIETVVSDTDGDYYFAPFPPQGDYQNYNYFRAEYTNIALGLTYRFSTYYSGYLSQLGLNPSQVYIDGIDYNGNSISNLFVFPDYTGPIFDNVKYQSHWGSTTNQNISGIRFRALTSQTGTLVLTGFAVQNVQDDYYAEIDFSQNKITQVLDVSIYNNLNYVQESEKILLEEDVMLFETESGYNYKVNYDGIINSGNFLIDIADKENPIQILNYTINEDSIVFNSKTNGNKILANNTIDLSNFYKAPYISIERDFEEIMSEKTSFDENVYITGDKIQWFALYTGADWQTKGVNIFDSDWGEKQRDINFNVLEIISSGTLVLDQNVNPYGNQTTGIVNLFIQSSYTDSIGTGAFSGVIGFTESFSEESYIQQPNTGTNNFYNFIDNKLARKTADLIDVTTDISGKNILFHYSKNLKPMFALQKDGLLYKYDSTINNSTEYALRTGSILLDKFGDFIQRQDAYSFNIFEKSVGEDLVLSYSGQPYTYTVGAYSFPATGGIWYVASAKNNVLFIENTKSVLENNSFQICCINKNTKQKKVISTFGNVQQHYYQDRDMAQSDDRVGSDNGNDVFALLDYLPNTSQDIVKIIKQTGSNFIQTGIKTYDFPEQVINVNLSNDGKFLAILTVASQGSYLNKIDVFQELQGGWSGFAYENTRQTSPFILENVTKMVVNSEEKSVYFVEQSTREDQNYEEIFNLKKISNTLDRYKIVNFGNIENLIVYQSENSSKIEPSKIKNIKWLESNSYILVTEDNDGWKAFNINIDSLTGTINVVQAVYDNSLIQQLVVQKNNLEINQNQLSNLNSEEINSSLFKALPEQVSLNNSRIYEDIDNPEKIIVKDGNWKLVNREIELKVEEIEADEVLTDGQSLTLNLMEEEKRIVKVTSGQNFIDFHGYNIELNSTETEVTMKAGNKNVQFTEVGQKKRIHLSDYTCVEVELVAKGSWFFIFNWGDSWDKRKRQLIVAFHLERRLQLLSTYEIGWQYQINLADDDIAEKTIDPDLTPSLLADNQYSMHFIYTWYVPDTWNGNINPKGSKSLKNAYPSDLIENPFGWPTFLNTHNTQHQGLVRCEAKNTSRPPNYPNSFGIGGFDFEIDEQSTRLDPSEWFLHGKLKVNFAELKGSYQDDEWYTFDDLVAFVRDRKAIDYFDWWRKRNCVLCKSKMHLTSLQSEVKHYHPDSDDCQGESQTYNLETNQPIILAQGPHWDNSWETDGSYCFFRTSYDPNGGDYEYNCTFGPFTDREESTVPMILSFNNSPTNPEWELYAEHTNCSHLVAHTVAYRTGFEPQGVDYSTDVDCSRSNLGDQNISIKTRARVFEIP